MNLEKINDYVGYYDTDIIGISITKSDGNWVNGLIDNHKFSAKVFGEPSSYGLYNGRISKLEIQKIGGKHWGINECEYGYDRGFDHATKEGKKLARKLLKVFPKNHGLGE